MFGLTRVFRRVPSADGDGASRGQVLAVFALFLIVLLGFTALAVDYGTYLLARREYQNTADAGALAGTSYLVRPITTAEHTDALEAAWNSVKAKLGLTGPNPSQLKADLNAGYSEGGWTVWIATPPADAGSAYLGDSSITGDATVYVRIQRDNPSFLARFFGINGRTIRAWATAGNQPSRWAVIALCPRNSPDCPSTAQDLTINGTGTTLKVIEGDVGDNWGLKTSGGTQLQLPDDSQAYLADTTCGNGSSQFRCYPDGTNVNDGGSPAAPRLVRVLPGPVIDPNYPEPSWIDDTTTAVPWRGDTNHDVSFANNSGTIQNASGTNVSCSNASPRVGPGRYRNIDVKQGSCVIFDPTYQLSDGQRPGIFVITGDFNIGNNSYVVGDGVTIFWTSTAASFNPTGGIILNTDNQNISGIPNGAAKWGAWTTLGNTPWSAATGTFPSATTSWTTPTGREVGIAFYVRKAASPTGIFNMSGQTPLMFNGLLYAPTDNVGIAGQGVQAAVGQIIGWTIVYSGGTTITQTYDGPEDTRAYLLEPRTGQPD